MKKLFVLLFLFAFITPSYSGRIIVPLEVKVFPFCTLKGKCKLSITFKNTLNLKVEVFSFAFVNNKPTYQGVSVITAEDYKNKKLEKNLLKKIKQEKKVREPLTFSNRLVFEPLEERAFILDRLDGMYNFKPDELYAVGYFLFFVNFYIDGEYALSDFISAHDYSFFRLPTKEFQPYIAN